MEWLIAVVAVAALGIAAMAAAGGMGQMAKEPVYDTYRQDLPGRPLAAEDLTGLRFGVSIRGYAMGQVDDLLDRLAREIAVRDTRLDEQSQEIARLTGHSGNPADPADADGDDGFDDPPTVEQPAIRLDEPAR